MVFYRSGSRGKAKEKLYRYNQMEQEFAAQIFLEMEEAGIIVRDNSD
jgi:hypothetical protein